MKVLIIAQPKSGVHLCANLVNELGIKNSYNHIFLNRMVNRTKKWYSNDFEWGQSDVEQEFSKSIQSIKQNTFAITQVMPTDYTKSVTNNCKKILLTRDNQSILESLQRFKDEKNIEIPFENIKLESYFDWANTENIFHITFNQLINKNIEVIDNLQCFLKNSISVDSSTAIDNAIRKNTPTKSSIRK